MKKYFLLLLFTAIALGLLFPAGQRLKPLLPVLLSILMFFNFYHMRLETHHFTQRGTLIYFLLVLVAFPWLIFTITQSFSAPFQLGMFLCTISPAAISGTIAVGIIGGNRENSTANIIIYNLLAPFTYTALMKLYFNSSDLNVPVGRIVGKLLLMVFLPFILSLSVKRSPGLSRTVLRLSAHTRIFFLLLLYTAISSSSRQLRTVPMAELTTISGIMLLLGGILYLSGLLLEKDLASRKALAINMGQKNSSLCIWLALSNFGPLAAIPPTVYIIVQHLYNSILIFYFSKERNKR